MAMSLMVRLRESLPSLWTRRRLVLPDDAPGPDTAVANDRWEIVGEQILLRPLGLEDAEAFFSYAGDSDVTRFLPWNPAPNVASVQPFLSEEMWGGRRGDSLRLAVVLRETGAVVGSTDLVDLLGARQNGQAEMGYLLAKAFWGRGLMSEAAYLTARHGFDALELQTIVAFADAQNVASVRVLEKIGMQDVGRETRVVKGENRLYRRFMLQRHELLPISATPTEGTRVPSVKSTT